MKRERVFGGFVSITFCLACMVYIEVAKQKFWGTDAWMENVIRKWGKEERERAENKRIISCDFVPFLFFLYLIRKFNKTNKRKTNVHLKKSFCFLYF